MKTKTLDIPLKGARDYIQGPDLCDQARLAMTDVAGGALDAFEIAFHRMARQQVLLSWDTDTAPAGAFAAGSWQRGDQRGRYWMQETDDAPSGRQAYPEEEIVAQMTFDAAFGHVQLSAALPYSDMELWVSMIKAMHQRRFPDAAGKWVFARAKLQAYDPDHAPTALRAELAATLGTKLTRNVVFQGEQKVGDVFFALM